MNITSNHHLSAQKCHYRMNLVQLLFFFTIRLFSKLIYTISKHRKNSNQASNTFDQKMLNAMLGCDCILKKFI